MKVTGGDLTVDGEMLLSPTTALPASSIPRADPHCFDNGNRFADCGNGTVTDAVTGLIWLQDASCSWFGPEDTYRLANDAALALGHGQCGVTDNSIPGDWRLPTKEEWEAIIDQGRANGCSAPYFPDTAGTGCYGVGPCPFSGVRSSFYWSPTSLERNPYNAWYVYLYYGYVDDNFKTFPYYVWPVGSGP
jgi:hypothetical protein